MSDSYDDPAAQLDATEVFVSYRSRASSSVAALLHKFLLERHLNVFLDFARIETGDEFMRVIERALRSPSLAVGVILMDEDWFSSFHDDLADDVVWFEVQSLLAKAATDDVNLYPIYFHEPGGGAAPLPPPPTHRQQAEIGDLYAKLKKINILRVVQRGDHQMEEIADAIADKVRRRSLDQRILGSLRAASVPPQPLCRLHADRRLRQGLRHYAEAHAGLGEVRLLTLLGQDALADRDFDRATRLLEHAWRHADVEHADDERKAGNEIQGVKQRTWLAHAANLLVVASLRGERPRRRKISQATYLFCDVLIPSVNFQAKGIGGWKDLDGEDDGGLWRESVVSVAGLSFWLFKLIGFDFFVDRGVDTPPRCSDRISRLRTSLPPLRAALSVDHRSWTDDETDFLYDRFLDGLSRDQHESRRERELASLTGDPGAEEDSR